MQSIFSTSVTKPPARRPITPPPAAPPQAPRPGKLVASPAMRRVAEPTSPAPAPKAKKWHDTYKRVRDMLAGRYPLIFSCARPLKVGIDRDLRAAIPEDELSNIDLRHFLCKWVSREPYRVALARGVRRVDLDGNDPGPANVNDAGQ